MGPAAPEVVPAKGPVAKVADWNEVAVGVRLVAQRMVGQRGEGPMERDARGRMGPVGGEAGLTESQDAAERGVPLLWKNEWVEEVQEGGFARGMRVALLPRPHLQCHSSRCLVDSSRTNPLWVEEVGAEACLVADRLSSMPPLLEVVAVWVEAPVVVEGLS